MTGTDPLHELLDLLVSEQAHTVAALARALGVDDALVEQMMDTLERAGYVRTLSAAPCASPCEHCPSGADCGRFLGGRIWTLTERARTLQR